MVDKLLFKTLLLPLRLALSLSLSLSLLPEYLWWVWSEQLKVLGELRISVPNLVDRAMAVSFLFLFFVLLMSILFFALNVWLSAWLLGELEESKRPRKFGSFALCPMGLN
jgi:hypothetical protein